MWKERCELSCTKIEKQDQKQMYRLEVGLKGDSFVRRSYGFTPAADSRLDVSLVAVSHIDDVMSKV